MHKTASVLPVQTSTLSYTEPGFQSRLTHISYNKHKHVSSTKYVYYKTDPICDINF